MATESLTPLMAPDPSELGQRFARDYRGTCARLDVDNPWFGAFSLRIPGKEIHYKLGERRIAEERILDWRHPLARAFYEAAPGDDFELDSPEYAQLSGRVAYLGKCTAEGRTLTRVDLRVKGGEYVLTADLDGNLTPITVRQRRRAHSLLPDIRALLSTEQYKLVSASRGRPLVIQGKAGSGKTTVALYRVSWLTYAAEDDVSTTPVDPGQVLIVMFNKALETFVERSLAPLKLEKARLSTFHGWALEAVQRAYGGKLEVDGAKGFHGLEEATRLKKQLGMLAALKVFVDEQTARAEVWLADKLGPLGGNEFVELFRVRKRTPVARRIAALRTDAIDARNASDGTDSARWDAIHKVLAQAHARVTQYKEDLLKFLTSRKLLAKHLDANSYEIEALANFQTTLQGLGGTSRRPGPKVHFDDLALLLRLIELKNGGLTDTRRDGEVFRYDHLVIDEVQDFGAVELRVLLDAVRSRTGVTIVGDHNQKIVPTADFVGWDGLVAELGVEDASVTRLSVGHRSTAPIMALAGQLLGEPAEDGRPGPRPVLHQVATDDALHAALVTWIAARVAEDPGGHHCVVCRQPTEAQARVDRLKLALPSLGVPIRVGHNKDFSFEPGVTVTNLRQIKGLEFDSVAVLGVSEEMYPTTDEGRRHLYTVVTRAKDALLLLVQGKATPLLAGAVASGLVVSPEVAATERVEFTDDDDDPF